MSTPPCIFVGVSLLAEEAAERRSSSVRIRGLKEGGGRVGREGWRVVESCREDWIWAVAAARERGEGGGSM